MITVWGRRSSSNVQAVSWCIEELGIDYHRIDAGFSYGVTDTEDYLSMNPNGTVPTIRDGDDPPIWETGAILRYLAGRYGDESFWPAEPVRRAAVDKWAEWSKLNIALMFTGPVFWAVVRTPVHRQDPIQIRKAVDEFEANLAIADRQLEHKRYIAGASFTLADIQFAHVLYRYYDISITRADFPMVAAYYQRLLQREPYRKHVALSYEELIGTK
ncbi:MAG: glutathione S-transferase family protein [Gammaproteobacteria bacterium]|nr:glutathione S-transferase family protein [Gammaproteobacteria bacterium]